MTCKIIDETGKVCGEPDLIKDVCYDHCVYCSVCLDEPASPHTRICENCIEEKISENN